MALFSQRAKKIHIHNFFVGHSYLKTLVADPKVSVGVGNVTFESSD